MVSEVVIHDSLKISVADFTQPYKPVDVKLQTCILQYIRIEPAAIETTQVIEFIGNSNGVYEGLILLGLIYVCTSLVHKYFGTTLDPLVFVDPTTGVLHMAVNAM